MKILLNLTLCTVLCATALAAPPREHKYPSGAKDPIHNGLWWQNKSSIFKEGFISGYKLGTEHTAGHPIDLNKFPSGQLLDGLDHFYGDFRNRSILFDDAIHYVEEQLRGQPDDKLTTELQHLRQAAAPAADDQ